MQPFSPSPASTVNIDVSASSQRVAVPARVGGTFRIMNNGTATVWVEFGNSSVTASMTTGFPVAPGAIEVLRCQNTSDGSGIYAAAIAAAATGKIYFTPGDGI